MMFKLITSLVTPLEDNNKIDIKSFFKLIDFQIENGVNDFVLFGTTGEGSLLSLKEKLKVTKLILNRYKKSNIIIGIANISSIDTCKEIKKFNDLNIKGYLVLTPYYISTNDKGLYKYFKNVNNVTKHPIYIYQIKKRTGQDFNLNILESCLNLKNIKGVKYSTNFEDVRVLNDFRKDNSYEIYLGNDEDLINGLNISLNGIISVISNIFPKQIKNIIELHQKGDVDTSANLFKGYDEFLSLLYKEINPLGVKYVLHLKGMIKEIYLDPLYGLTYQTKSKLKKKYQEINDEN